MRLVGMRIMPRRFRLPHVQGSNRIISILIAALLLIGVGGFGLSHLVQSQGSTSPSTATPLAFAQKDPPSTPTAMPGTPGASPAAATPGQTATATAKDAKAACSAKGATSVKKVPDGYAGPGKVIVIDDAVNLRSGPSTDCPIVGSLGMGQEVVIRSGLLKNGKYYWRQVTTGEGEGYAIASAFQRPPKNEATFVPVLMYHHIAEGNDNLHVPPAEFEQQIAWLKKNGYVSITTDDLYRALYKGLKLPAKPIMLTIDDGNPSTETFKKILDKYGFKGVYFLPNYAELSKAQIKALDKDGEVCGHTVSHQFLGQLSYDDQYYQIMNNKEWLEKIVGHKVTCFAYPFGSYNDNTNAIMAKSGYTMGFNAWGGAQPLVKNVDPYHILRKEIDPQFDLNTFIQIVTQGW
jgi:peptidoglycan/xylan/chitin deacetylase (PgdA/CDA1 family)